MLQCPFHILPWRESKFFTCSKKKINNIRAYLPSLQKRCNKFCLGTNDIRKNVTHHQCYLRRCIKCPDMKLRSKKEANKRTIESLQLFGRWCRKRLCQHHTPNKEQ